MASRAEWDEIFKPSVASVLVYVVDQEDFRHSLESAIGASLRKGLPCVLPVAARSLLAGLPLDTTGTRTVEVTMILRDEASPAGGAGTRVFRRLKAVLLSALSRAKDSRFIRASLPGQELVVTTLAGQRWEDSRLALIVRKSKMMTMFEFSPWIHRMLTASARA